MFQMSYLFDKRSMLYSNSIIKVRLGASFNKRTYFFSNFVIVKILLLYRRSPSVRFLNKSLSQIGVETKSVLFSS